MQNLLDFLISIKHWLLFFFLEGVSLLYLFSYSGYQNSVYFTTANDLVGSSYSAISSVMSYLNLQDENRNLEAENEILRKEIADLKSRLKAIKADSLNVKWLKAEYNIVGAEIVNATLHKSNNLFTINKGEADGVKPEMGVVCSNGVVGVIYMTSQHYSIVIPILNQNSRISCRIRRTDHFGTLEWKRGRSDIAYMMGVPRHAAVKVGDVIETNGYSDIFPAGIPLAQVIKKSDSSDGLSYTLKSALYTNFQTLREVSVITNYTKPERRTLEERADSLNNKE